ncbi:hypothetical protein V6C03_00810 [Methyloligella sp. 2.7D]|uniref:hypothetical protein n=1 Tax=unclassified Methyloligella TaxID=2625955 RepID=UPI00157CB7CC|nr:hypothetical protein [Methyloligella sp. GL2]QKP76791.1 hypothetical protein HT051_04605 [Methyloligella sp. GL2]
MAVLVALLPIVTAAKTGFFEGSSLFEKIRSAGLMRDLVFLAVVAAVGSVTEIVYHIATKGFSLPDWARAVAILGSCYFIYVIVYGTVRFSLLVSSGQPATETDVSSDVTFVGTCLVMVLFAQLAVDLTE